MPSQSALVLRTRFGRFSTVTIPIPTPGSGEVLIKVHSTALNPADCTVQRTGAFVETYPAVLGLDIAGEVVKLGPNASFVEVGDRVMVLASYSNAYAGYQQYILAKDKCIAKIPDSVSSDEASTLPLACTTAYLALYRSPPYGLGIPSPLSSTAPSQTTGEPILIIGGSSSVGQAAIQFAKASGFNPILTTSSPNHTARLRALGATHVVDRHHAVSPLLNTIRQELPDGCPLTYVVDVISAKDTQHLAMCALEKGRGGRVVMTHEPIFADGFEGKRISYVTAFGKETTEGPELREFWRHLPTLVANGTIKPSEYRILCGGLDGVVGGLAALEDKSVSGTKLIVHPQETAPSYT